MSSVPNAEYAREMRATARRIFLKVLGDIVIQTAFERHVQYDRGVLRIADDLYLLKDFARVFVISMGKAARTMVDALRHEVGDTVTGIVADPIEGEQAPGFRYFRGGHPVPNAESLRAGEAILKSLRALDPHSLVIYLLSGGSSAVVEQPGFEEISLADLVETYRALVLCGAPIAEINAIRKHLSATKGGRMAQAAPAGAQQVSIMVSDVPDNALDALGSGPTMPDTTTVADCHAIAAKYELIKQFPAAVRELFAQHALEETPKPGDAVFARSRWWPILSNETARQAAAGRAAEAGFAVELDVSCDDWDYARAADYLLARLRDLRRGVSRVCLVSGGEVTVKVTGEGRGGRNQHFALHCAENIAGENIAVLSASTDGVDGNSPACGAVVDGTTLERARARGLDPPKALAAFDSYPLLEALGDALITGPTGNNVRDLRILLAW